MSYLLKNLIRNIILKAEAIGKGRNFYSSDEFIALPCSGSFLKRESDLLGSLGLEGWYWGSSRDLGNLDFIKMNLPKSCHSKVCHQCKLLS